MFACIRVGTVGFHTSTEARRLLLLLACGELTLMLRLLQIIRHVFPSLVWQPPAWRLSLSAGMAIPVFHICWISRIPFLQTFEWMPYVQFCIVDLYFDQIHMRQAQYNVVVWMFVFDNLFVARFQSQLQNWSEVVARCLLFLLHYLDAKALQLLKLRFVFDIATRRIEAFGACPTILPGQYLEFI